MVYYLIFDFWVGKSYCYKCVKFEINDELMQYVKRFGNCQPTYYHIINIKFSNRYTKSFKFPKKKLSQKAWTFP